jgi:small basic protein (TIGR04137 family)
MSVHTSLRTLGGGASAGSRSVLKRHERVRWLLDHDKWDEGRSVFGLPKIKQVRIKARKAAKEKPEAEGATAAAGGAAAPAAEAKTAEAKPTKPAKAGKPS